MRTNGESREMPTSRWSLVMAAQVPSNTGRRLALDELLRLYYAALHAHLVMRLGLNPATADDVLQGFIAEKILERDILAGAHPSKGRFRSLLLKSLTNYAIDGLRRRRARPEGALPTWYGEDAPLPEPAVNEPVDPFDAAWAREVLSQALKLMRTECESQACPERWSIFEKRILMPAFRGESPLPYDQLVEEFQFASPQQASNALVTAKRHFQRVLRQVVGDYSGGESECIQELIDLHTIVATAGPLNVQLFQLDLAMQPSIRTGHAAESTTVAEGLATLFLVEDADCSAWKRGDYAGIWRHLLDQPLRGAIRGAGTSQLEMEAIDVENETIGDLLRQTSPRLASLVALKEAARSFVRESANDLPGEIATALYFASIAAALVRRQIRISKSDDTILRYGFDRLATRSWLDANTIGLVDAALHAIE
jgi:DNA-directed RNA polymerase specialized sigma24 family protein